MIDDTTWVNSPEPGWATMQAPPAALGDGFISGKQSESRLIVRYFRHEADGELRAKILLGAGTQGPPGHVHGGCMAALLDEAMGAAAWMQRHLAVAAELTIRFKTMLPIGTRCLIAARVTSVAGRKVNATATIQDESGAIYCEGDALFVTVGAERLGISETGIADHFAGAAILLS